jgi:hypothetical protein
MMSAMPLPMTIRRSRGSEIMAMAELHVSHNPHLVRERHSQYALGCGARAAAASAAVPAFWRCPTAPQSVIAILRRPIFSNGFLRQRLPPARKLDFRRKLRDKLS